MYACSWVFHGCMKRYIRFQLDLHSANSSLSNHKYCQAFESAPPRYKFRLVSQWWMNASVTTTTVYGMKVARIMLRDNIINDNYSVFWIRWEKFIGFLKYDRPFTAYPVDINRTHHIIIPTVLRNSTKYCISISIITGTPCSSLLFIVTETCDKYLMPVRYEKIY